MKYDNNSIIYPCPFSKGYGIPEQQAWLSLKVYLIYRFILASLILILYSGNIGPSFLASHDVTLFQYSSSLYLILTIATGFCIYLKVSSYVFQAQILIFTDIIFITLIMHACGGLVSGMGLLLVVSTAAGGLLIGGRCAMLFAALASLAILSEQIYADQTNVFATTAYGYSGMLGAVFFAIAFLSYILAQRTEQSEIISNLREKTILQLEELNQYIIQHLQSGIIITDQNHNIKMSNEAAKSILKQEQLPATIEKLSAKLATALYNWSKDEQQDYLLLKLAEQTQIHTRFNKLPTQYENFYMVILEDVSLYHQRLQQSKLASLGRLTASIAHEIRNPLGAISHAGQLLSENSELPAQEKRLTEIIQTHSARVNQIIEDILELSRRNPSKRKTFNLDTWAENYLNNFIIEHNIAADRINLELPGEELAVEIDPGHLKQILDNLCHNAMRHGKSTNEKIILKVYKFNQLPCIEVVNPVSGINSEVLEHIFEPFYTTSSSGTGLGLYISRELAELNQAKLSYQLSPENSICFRLCLLDAKQKMIAL